VKHPEVYAAEREYHLYESHYSEAKDEADYLYTIIDPKAVTKKRRSRVALYISAGVIALAAIALIIAAAVIRKDVWYLIAPAAAFAIVSGILLYCALHVKCGKDFISGVTDQCNDIEARCEEMKSILDEDVKEMHAAYNGDAKK
jgi:hypothetical protein